MGKNIDARDYYQKALELSPKSTNYLFNIGYSYEEEKNYFKAIEYFDKVLIEDFEHIESIRAKARSLFKVGNLNESLNFINSYLSRKVFDVGLLIIRADININKGQYELALNDLYKVVAIDFEDPNISSYIKIGDCLKKLSNFQEEIGIRYAIVLKIERNIDNKELIGLAHFDLARALYSNNELENSLKEFDKAIEIQPINGLFYFRRSMVKARLKQLEPACKDLNYSFDLNPDDKKDFILFIKDNPQFDEFLKYCVPNLKNEIEEEIEDEE